MEVLIKTADADGDGKISLEDFRNMLNFKCVLLTDARKKGELMGNSAHFFLS